MLLLLLLLCRLLHRPNASLVWFAVRFGVGPVAAWRSCCHPEGVSDVACFLFPCRHLVCCVVPCLCIAVHGRVAVCGRHLPSPPQVWHSRGARVCRRPVLRAAPAHVLAWGRQQRRQQHPGGQEARRQPQQRQECVCSSSRGCGQRWRQRQRQAQLATQADTPAGACEAPQQGVLT